jgi:hypothetical protein
MSYIGKFVLNQIDRAMKRDYTTKFIHTTTSTCHRRLVFNKRHDKNKNLAKESIQGILRVLAKCLFKEIFVYVGKEY